jgi:hypothetical protein
MATSGVRHRKKVAARGTREEHDGDNRKVQASKNLCDYNLIFTISFGKCISRLLCAVKQQNLQPQTLFTNNTKQSRKQHAWI